MNAILETNIDGLPKSQGKVRDIYQLNDQQLVLVATDRISAFDWVLPTGIPDKGRILTGISTFWFDLLDVPNHWISTNIAEMGSPFASRPDLFAGRSMLVRKVEIVPIECVVRGYLAGSGWKEYRQSGTVVGQKLPAGLKESDPLPEPIFTPATKATSGHDENISIERMAELVGPDVTESLKQLSLSIYSRASDYARTNGIILADTKFEFGRLAGEFILADEVLTPDSSRFWPAETYRPGGPQLSYDKQYVRDWLESIGFDKQSVPPPMPDEVVLKTRAKYVEAYEQLTGKKFV